MLVQEFVSKLHVLTSDMSCMPCVVAVKLYQLSLINARAVALRTSAQDDWNIATSIFYKLSLYNVMCVCGITITQVIADNVKPNAVFVKCVVICVLD